MMGLEIYSGVVQRWLDALRLPFAGSDWLPLYSWESISLPSRCYGIIYQ